MEAKQDEEQKGTLQPKQQSKKPKPLRPIDYEYLNGLRGWGAFAVFFFHLQQWFWRFEKEPKKAQSDFPFEHPNVPYWQDVFKNSPLGVLIDGNTAVSMFFILSGFVLPLSWLKSRSYTSIYGGLFRRYLRLMLPMLLNLSIYYFVAKLDFTTRKRTFQRVKTKSFPEFLLDTTIGVWFMNTDYVGFTWTLSVELFASYFIYVIAFVPINYRGRWWIYGLTLLFAYLPRLSDAYQYTQYGFDNPYGDSNPKLDFDKKVRHYLPTFAIGVIFADLDTVNINGRRPLDVIRKLPLWAKIPLNLFLFAIFCVFGVVETEHSNNLRETQYQQYHLTVSFGYTIGFPMCKLIAALALFFLCLTSRVAQIILSTRPFQFLGEISYCLYLIHGLIVEWPIIELQHYWFNNGVDYDNATYYAILIFTPVLILLSWLLTIAFDTPSKNLVMDLDMNCRMTPPKPRKGKAPIKQVGFAEYFITRWQVWAIAIYLLALFIVTETYQCFDGNRERIADSGYHRKPGMLSADDEAVPNQTINSQTHSN